MRLALPALLLCLITASPAFCDDALRPPIPISSQQDDFPAFGIALTPPAGWTRDQSAGAGRVGRWIKFDDQGKADAFLEVDFARASATNAQEWQHLTNDLHATSLRVVHTGNNLDGAWAKGSFENGGMTATHLFVVARDTTQYTAALVRKAAPSDKVAAADDALMMEFITHWKWRDLEEPSAHLELLDKPFSALGGVISLSVPAIAQMATADDPRTHLQFQVTNLKAHNAEMVVEMSLQPTPMPDMHVVGRIVKEKMHLADDLEWTSVAGKWSISQWAKVSRDENPYWVLYGGIAVDESHSVLVSCTLYRPEASVQRAYWESVKAVVAGTKTSGGKAAP